MLVPRFSYIAWFALSAVRGQLPNSCKMKLLIVASMFSCLSLVRADLEHSRPSRRETSTNNIFPRASPEENNGAYWNLLARLEIQASLNNPINTNVAKNVILFLGDGMSIQTIMAARVYDGQLKGNSGEEGYLSWEKFSHLGLSKTYNVDYQVPDSAGTAAAFLNGVKTNKGLIGVDANVELGNCTSMADNYKFSSIAKWSQDAGKRTGVVTSTRITHATPANVYAYSPDRDWECDDGLPANYQTVCPAGTKDIAAQLIDNVEGKGLNVIMGGGFQTLDGSAVATPNDPIDGFTGTRQDGRVLWQEWLDEKALAGQTAAFVRTKSALAAVDLANTDYVMGIYANSHVPYEYLKRQNGLDIPTLAEMTEAAITVLDKGTNGFFLLVEGGRIDLAHHSSKARTSLDETVAFSEAIQKALDMTNAQETLIIVTSDHSHTMTVAGYPERGNDITAIAGLTETGRDRLTYTTLSYANGPGFNYVGDGAGGVTRPDLATANTTSFDYVQASTIDMSSETHGGEDVAIYANGPWSHLIHSVHEQNYIAHVMAYASCVGGYDVFDAHCSGLRFKRRF